MGDTYLVSGLKKLRAERMGDLQGVRERMADLEAEALRIEAVLGHVDGVLREVAPAENLEAIQPVRTNRSRGQAQTGRKPSRRDGINGSPVPRDVLTVMRQENTPLTASQITDCVMVLRPDEDRNRVDKSVRSCLAAKTAEGLIGRVDYPDGEIRFSIID
jgi:hypothetical protein